MSTIEKGLSAGQSVLFLSFSKAAVARIADTAKAQLRTADSNRFSIQTFHSFFWRVLQAHGYLLGSRRQLSVIATHEEASLRAGAKEGTAEWAAWEEVRYGLFKSEGRVSFDLFAPLAFDLLAQCRRILRRYSRRFPLIVVDEAQDTNDSQWEIVRLLSGESSIVCLADPDQMIYGHLPGVRPERVQLIRAALTPCEIDLGTDNNRSPGTDIVRLAKDIYARHVGAKPYKGVTIATLPPTDAITRASHIRAAVGRLRNIVIQETGHAPESIGILTTYTRGVACVSSALQSGKKPIPHQVLFDESFVLLSARALAYLMEPKTGDDDTDVADLLDLCASAYWSKAARQTHRATALRLRKYASGVRSGKKMQFKSVLAARTVIQAVNAIIWSGHPSKDWIVAKNLLRTADDETIRKIAEDLDYVVAFGRGQRIEEGLNDLWMTSGTYAGARTTLDLALAQDQLLSAQESTAGIHVMNVHKAKGKQFEGVVLMRLEHESPFVWRAEPAPYEQGRRLLHMALTRASKHVLIVNQAFPACPILRAHKLP